MADDTKQISGNKRSTYDCSFCGKSQDQVQRLVAGPGGVYICDECIDLCREIIEEEQTIQQPQQDQWVKTAVAKKKATIRCESCRVTNPATYNYCFNCGHKLKEET